MIKTKNRIQFIIIIFLCLLVVPVSFAQESVTVVRIMPVNAEMGVGETIQIAVEIANVSELYGADVTVNFDPTVLEVVDADPELEDIQVGFGTFLDPGFVLRNSADNATGVIRFAMTQLNPSEAKNGTGVFAVITFLARQENAETPINLSDAQLATRFGTEILTQVESGTLSIITDTPGGPTRTPIPIQLPGTPLPDTTDNLVTNTPGPTATTSNTNDVTNTPPVPTATAVVTNTPTINNPQPTANSNAVNPTQPPTPTPNNTETNPAATDEVSTVTLDTKVEITPTINTDGADPDENDNAPATAVSTINPTIGAAPTTVNQNAAQVIGENVQAPVTAVPTTNVPAENSPLPFILGLLVCLIVILIIAVIIIQRRQSHSQG
ncbi:MAG: hypothetical protein KDE48_11830 [Anaerolineales bacterium]|nr:hypothetical protein [Anaerolineales bacterium]